MIWRVNLVTLGVADIGRATAFYEKLGLQPSSASNANVTFFHAGAAVLSLFDRDALRDDAAAGSVWSGNGGITLARNMPSEADVDEAMAVAESAGATVLKAPQRAFWGGYHAFFADPDGHVWELAFNPFFPLDTDGNIVLPA